jgi:hypothetical protein
MKESQANEKELLKSLLEPLLQDFQYWFARSRNLLETQRLGFFSEEEQRELLRRIQQGQQEVSTVQVMFQATGGQVGIDPQKLVPWHKLVTECWQVSRRWRYWQQENNPTLE